MDPYRMQVGCGCAYAIAGVCLFLLFWGIVLHFVFKFW